MDRWEQNLDAVLRNATHWSVALSGGIDSAVLAAAVKRTGYGITAFTIQSAFVTQKEIDQAVSLCRQFDIPHIVTKIGLLDRPLITANGPDRCYQCKSLIFQHIRQQLVDEQTVLADGSTRDDLPRDRPGMRALSEWSVVSPLREAGLRKPHVRQLAAAWGIPYPDRAANSCLATRIPPGILITKERLKRVQVAENHVHRLGIGFCRVRDHYPRCVIEFSDNDHGLVTDRYHDILECMRSVGYTEMTLKRYRQTI